MQTAFLPLSSALDASQAGRKAAALAALDDAGLPVPSSIVIPAEVPGPALPSVSAQILAWAAGIPSFSLVARSSARAEDGGHASFAGLFTSRFAPLNASELSAALQAVRASATAPAARAYASAHRLELDTAMPVLVQPALRPYAAGVLAGELDHSQWTHWRIEAVHGLAEPLVSGTVTGEAHQDRDSGPAPPEPARQRFLVLPGTEEEMRTLPGEHVTLPHRHLSPAHAKIAFSADGLLRLYRPSSWAASPILSHRDCTELLRIAKRASTVLRLNRIDLEWALLPNGEFFILQARPLTTPMPRVHTPGRASAGPAWHGLPAAPGLAAGRAAHLGNADITPDTILICPALTPGTVSALLTRPAAIVAATGGTLSHTAIVARELGIPCVTNVTDAMTVIPPGLHAEVNGTHGTIRPVPAPPAGPAAQPAPAGSGEEPRASIICRLPGASSTGTCDGSAVIIDQDRPCTPGEVLAFLARAGHGTAVLLTDPRSAVPGRLPGYRQYEIDHLVRLIWPAAAARPPTAVAATDPAGRILHQRPRRPRMSPALPPDILPDDLAGFARSVLGACALAGSRSWPYHGGEVWELTGPDGIGYILKHHPADRHFRRETEGLRWAPALGPGRAPRLLAADGTLRAVILTTLPGISLADANLSASDERAAYAQAGQLVQLLHAAIPAATDTRVLDRLLGNADEHLAQVRDELTGPQLARLRSQVRHMKALAPQLPAVATHGDFQPRNLLWDPVTRRLAVIDFDKAAPAPAVRDLALLEAGPFPDREDLSKAFYQGFGRALDPIEHEALTALLVLDSLAALAWAIPNGDTKMATRARHVLATPGNAAARAPALSTQALPPASGVQARQ